jgi:hypothetical protein
MSDVGARSQSNEAKQAGGATRDPVGNVIFLRIVKW